MKKSKLIIIRGKGMNKAKEILDVFRDFREVLFQVAGDIANGDISLDRILQFEKLMMSWMTYAQS
jgi:hypothetical protein